jgi:hypothetical protein
MNSLIKGALHLRFSGIVGLKFSFLHSFNLLIYSFYPLKKPTSKDNPSLGFVKIEPYRFLCKISFGTSALLYSCILYTENIETTCHALRETPASIFCCLSVFIYDISCFDPCLKFTIHPSS